METLLNWISINSTLVYILLFGYCFAKSGAIPLFAGVLVAADVLLIGPVVVATFMGAYLGDELRFYLGRNYGGNIQKKWPRTKSFIETGKALMEKYGPWYIFLYRYPKGMRTIGAFPVGMSNMPYKLFLLLNVSSALLWGFVLVGAGVFLGTQAQSFGQEYYGVVSLILFLCFILWIRFLFKKHKLHKTSSEEL